MLSVSGFSSAAMVSLIDDAKRYPSAVESEVEHIWSCEQQSKDGALFNGQIYSVREFSSEKILGHVVEYRYLIAQMAQPSLFDILQVIPLAVSGVFVCPDGIVFGRRSEKNTQEGGKWELVPSGGIDANSVIFGEEVDYRAQLLAELVEEVGVAPSTITDVTPFCLIYDDQTHVLDIGIALFSSLSSATLLQTHQQLASDEYGEVCVIPLHKLEEFIRNSEPGVIDVSKKLLECYMDYFNKRELNFL